METMSKVATLDAPRVLEERSGSDERGVDVLTGECEQRVSLVQERYGDVESEHFTLVLFALSHQNRVLSADHRPSDLSQAKTRVASLRSVGRRQPTRALRSQGESPVCCYGNDGGTSW